MSSIPAFDKVAGEYDAWYNHPQGKQVFTAELNAVDQLLPPKGIGLELGAGTGIFSKHLTKCDRKIICLDPSEEMLSKAMERGLPIVRGLGDHQPFRAGVLDFTFLVTVMEFLDKPVQVFSEVASTTKSDASLTILFINSDSPWGEFYREIGSKGDTVFQHAKIYTLSEARETLRKAGYVIQQVVGTLNSGPMESPVDGSITPPSEESGVLVIKTVRKGYTG